MSTAATIDHFFHLAAIYDMTADDEANQSMNVGGTRHALELAEALKVGCFHQVSSVAAAGEYDGPFDESMFDEGQALTSPYHRTKFESEKLVRDEATVPWRVYRPAIVVGHSETGAMDKVDGPYYLFPAIKLLRDTLPAWLPLVGVDLGDTNVVPVDYVAAASTTSPTSRATTARPSTSSTPSRSRWSRCSTPSAARRARRSSRRRSTAAPAAACSGSCPRPCVRCASPPAWSAPGRSSCCSTRPSAGSASPPEVLAHTSFRPVFDSRRTEKALAGSGIAVPDLESYARTLWGYWEDHLDQSTGHDAGAREALTGKYVVITGASSGIGQVTALKVAQAGGIPVLIARGKDKLEATRATIENRGGTAYVYACDLSDLEAIDGLCAAAHDRPRPASTSWSTTPVARSAARCGSPRTASTTSSAPCS